MKELLIIVAAIIIWFHGVIFGFGKGEEYAYKEAISKGAGTYVVDNNKTISFKWNCEK